MADKDLVLLTDEQKAKAKKALKHARQLLGVMADFENELVGHQELEGDKEIAATIDHLRDETIPALEELVVYY